MGVLHMTFPLPGVAGPRHPRPAIEAPPQTRRTPPEPGTRPAARNGPELRVPRTPEQQAEQDALAVLVGGCLAGDQRAWQRLVAEQHKRVYAICYRFTGDATEAEDLTQDVFLKVYRNMAAFDAERGSFGTWITTLTRNLLVDNYRRTRVDRASESLDQSLGTDDDGPTMAERLADPRPSQEQQYGRQELKAAIQRALGKLSPELREAVILRDLEDMDYKEIALVLKIPEGTVKSRISRGRAELARLLQRMEGQVM